MMKKNKIFERIEILYLLVFVLITIIVAPTHIFPQPTFMYARFPHYLEMMKPFFGISWPATFEIYHDVLYILAIIISLNALGIVFYPRLKKLATLSSIIGLPIFSLMVLFFFLKFISINASTAIIYGALSLTLLLLDFLTLKALTRQKVA